MRKNRSSKFVLIYLVLSLLIFIGCAIGAILENDFTSFLIAVVLIAIQWGVYYLLRLSIRLLKSKSPKQWPILLSTWIACVSLLLWGFICLSMSDYDDGGYTLVQFFIGSVCIVTVLVTVIYSIKAISNNKNAISQIEHPPQEDPIHISNNLEFDKLFSDSINNGLKVDDQGKTTIYPCGEKGKEFLSFNICSMYLLGRDLKREQKEIFSNAFNLPSDKWELVHIKAFCIALLHWFRSIKEKPDIPSKLRSSYTLTEGMPLPLLSKQLTPEIDLLFRSLFVKQ